MSNYIKKYHRSKLEIYQGRTFREPYQLMLDEDTPYNLSDATITGAFKKSILDVAEITPTIEIIDSANGKVDMILSDTQTRAMTPSSDTIDEYVFDFNIKNDVSGEIDSFDSGNAKIIQEVEDVS